MSDDYELLSAWRGGDRDAGEQLFARHFRSVARFFKNKVDAGVDDLVQDTFLACVEAAETFEGRSSFRTWVLAIARNKLYMHYRRKRGRKVDELSESVADLGCQTGSFGSWMADAEEQRLLLAALRRLPLETQTMLELYYWEELGGPELALALGLEYNTLRSRLVRARSALRAQIEQLAANPSVAETTLRRLEAGELRPGAERG